MRWEGWGGLRERRDPDPPKFPPPPPPTHRSVTGLVLHGFEVTQRKCAVCKSRFFSSFLPWSLLRGVPEKKIGRLASKTSFSTLHLTVCAPDGLAIIMTTSENLEESGSWIIHPSDGAKKKFWLYVPIALQCALIIGVWTALFLPIAFHHLPVSEVRAWVYIIYFLSLAFAICLPFRLDRFYDSV